MMGQTALVIRHFHAVLLLGSIHPYTYETQLFVSFQDDFMTIGYGSTEDGTLYKARYVQEVNQYTVYTIFILQILYSILLTFISMPHTE